MSKNQGKRMLPVGAKINADVLSAFQAFCEREGFKMYRALERAILLFLDAQDSKQCKRFLVELSDSTAEELEAFRAIRDMPDRNCLFDTAIQKHIQSQLTDDDTRSHFQTMLRKGKPN